MSRLTQNWTEETVREGGAEKLRLQYEAIHDTGRRKGRFSTYLRQFLFDNSPDKITLEEKQKVKGAIVALHKQDDPEAFQE